MIEEFYFFQTRDNTTRQATLLRQPPAPRIVSVVFLFLTIWSFWQNQIFYLGIVQSEVVCLECRYSCISCKIFQELHGTWNPIKRWFKSLNFRLSWKSFIVRVDYNVEGRGNCQQKVIEFNQDSPPQRLRLEFSIQNDLGWVIVS